MQEKTKRFVYATKRSTYLIIYIYLINTYCKWVYKVVELSSINQLSRHMHRNLKTISV